MTLSPNKQQNSYLMSESQFERKHWGPAASLWMSQSVDPLSWLVLQNKCQRNTFLCDAFVQAEFCIPLSSQLRVRIPYGLEWNPVLVITMDADGPASCEKNFCRHKDFCKCLHVSLMSSAVTPPPCVTVSWSSQRQHDLSHLVCRNIHCWKRGLARSGTRGNSLLFQISFTDLFVKRVHWTLS